MKEKNFQQFLKENSEILYEIENKIREKYELPLAKTSNDNKKEIEKPKETVEKE